METVLIFVGIPVAVAVVIYGLVYGGSARRGSKRYRPGRPFDFRPVWFVSAPELLRGSDTEAPAVSAGPSQAAVTAGATPGGSSPAGASAVGASTIGPSPAGSGEWPGPDPAQQAVTGGASDRW